MPTANDYVKQFAPPAPDDDSEQPPPPLQQQGPTAGAAPVTTLPGDYRGLEAAQAIRHGLGVAGGQVPASVANVVRDPLRFGAQLATGEPQPDIAATYPSTPSALDAYEAAAGRGATEGATIGGGVGFVTGGPAGALTGAAGGALTGAIGGLGSEFVQRNFPNSLWGYGPEVTGAVLSGGKEIIPRVGSLGLKVAAIPLHLAHGGLAGLASSVGHVANHIAGGILMKSGAWGRRLVNSVIGTEAGVQNQTAGYQAQEQQQEQQPANGLLPPAAAQTQ